MSSGCGQGDRADAVMAMVAATKCCEEGWIPVGQLCDTKRLRLFGLYRRPLGR